MAKENPKATNPAAAAVAGMAAPFPQSSQPAATEGAAKETAKDTPQPTGAPPPGQGGEIGTHAVGEAGDTKGSAGDVAGPASLGNQDDASARASAPQPQPVPAQRPDTLVAIVPNIAPVRELLPNGMPKDMQGEVDDERHWIYKRSGEKFWKTTRPGLPKPVIMRNATHTWDGTEAEFKDQFERD